MSVTVHVKIGDLGRRLKLDGEARAKALRVGMRRGADRGVAHLVRQSRAVVYMGQFMNSWRREDYTADKITIRNDAPHAGVIERGARPHGVSVEGQEALLRWVELKMGPVEDARGIVWAICQRIRRDGVKGHFIVRDAMDELVRLARVEVEREMNQAAGK